MPSYTAALQALADEAKAKANGTWKDPKRLQLERDEAKLLAHIRGLEERMKKAGEVEASTLNNQLKDAWRRYPCTAWDQMARKAKGKLYRSH